MHHCLTLPMPQSAEARRTGDCRRWRCCPGKRSSVFLQGTVLMPCCCTGGELARRAGCVQCLLASLVCHVGSSTAGSRPGHCPAVLHSRLGVSLVILLKVHPACNRTRSWRARDTRSGSWRRRLAGCGASWWGQRLEAAATQQLSTPEGGSGPRDMREGAVWRRAL